MGQRILLSSVGTSPPRHRAYSFHSDALRNVGEGSSVGAHPPSSRQFSALALWELLDEHVRPQQVWFLLTPAASEIAWAAIEAEAAKVGVVVRGVPIGGGEKANDPDHFLHTAAEELPADCTLIVDITQGLRHHGFLFFALTLYLSMFRNVTLDGVWYARKESNDPRQPKHFIDLKPVQKLSNWFLALSVFKETGSTRELGHLVSHKKLKGLLQQFSEEFMTGLPMEAGITASQVSKLLATLGPAILGVPLETELHATVLNSIAPYCLDVNPKKGRELDEAELQRQRAFIDQYLRSGQNNLAYGFMREWVISSVMHQADVRRGWLDGRTRQPYENRLSALSRLMSADGDPNKARLDETQRSYAKRWQQLTGVRNRLQHHGMDEGDFPKKPILALLEAWRSDVNWAQYPPLGGDAGQLLICPVGQAIGVLYSALTHVKPRRCLVVCTEQSAPWIEEAVRAAAWTGEHQLLIIKDSKAGYSEYPSLLKAAKEWLFDAEHVAASLTGGTTSMSIFAGQLVRHAASAYHRPTWEFVLVDRRPREEQRRDPWVVSEIETISGACVDVARQTSARLVSPGG